MKRTLIPTRRGRRNHRPALTEIGQLVAARTWFERAVAEAEKGRRRSRRSIKRRHWLKHALGGAIAWPAPALSPPPVPGSSALVAASRRATFTADRSRTSAQD